MIQKVHKSTQLMTLILLLVLAMISHLHEAANLGLHYPDENVSTVDA